MPETIDFNQYLSLWPNSSHLIQSVSNVSDADCMVQVRNILAKRMSKGLTDAEAALLASALQRPNFHMIAELVFQSAAELRIQVFGNQVALMAPVELSSFCASNCEFCTWRVENNLIPRTRQSIDSFDIEISTLLDRGVRHIELASGDDLRFLKNNLANFIDRAKQVARKKGIQDLRISACVTPLHQENYADLKNVGLDCVLTWQETYNRDRYLTSVRSGPKRFGVNPSWVSLTEGDGYLFRISSQESAIRTGLQVGLGTMLEKSEQLPVEILAVISHAKLLLQYYPNALPIIFGMPVVRRNVDNNLQDTVEDLSFWDLAFPYITSLYLLSLPNGKAWPFPNCRVPLAIQAKSVQLAGNFTSTEVRLVPGGYTRDATILGDLDAIQMSNQSVLKGEQFEHFYHEHEQYVEEFKRRGLIQVTDSAFLRFNQEA